MHSIDLYLTKIFLGYFIYADIFTAFLSLVMRIKEKI